MEVSFVSSYWILAFLTVTCSTKLEIFHKDLVDDRVKWCQLFGLDRKCGDVGIWKVSEIRIDDTEEEYEDDED